MTGRLFFFIFLIFLIFAMTAESQSVLLPEEEAPESIFSSKIGDSDVDFFLSGFWKSSLSGGAGFAWDSDGSDITGTSFPGFSDGLIFSQNTDLTISLWLQNQYFFEASIIDNYTLNTILFGYDAEDENAFLKEVRIGNTDIGLGRYSLLNLPAASTDSLGIMTLFKGPGSEHQFVLRFDPAEKAKKSFKGDYEIQETRIGLTDYTEGAFFILPDNDVENLKVYIEDDTGIYSDGTSHYRLADSDDAVISTEEGYIFFRESQDRKIAVHYTKNISGSSVTVGTDNASMGVNALSAESSGKIDITGTARFYFSMGSYLGIDMSTLETTINGETSLLIYQPGVFSPFQMLSVYSLPFDLPDDNTPFNALLADMNTSKGEQITYQHGLHDKTIMFTLNDDNSLRNPANRYPFADKIDSDTRIYEPDRLTTGTPPGKELLIEQYEKITTYNLGDNVLDGSVEMRVNGGTDNRFTFNPESGNIKLLFPAGADDRIDFYYRTKAAARQGGDLLAGAGSRFIFNDTLSMEIGAGLRWNISKGRYTERQNEAPGSILASGGITYNGEKIKLKIDGGVSFHSADTTGIFRLLGMNTSGLPVSVSGNMLYPAAPPADITSLTNDNRGQLLYKDYNLYESSGSSILMNYDWYIPSDQEYPYSDGGRTGPYPAAAKGEIEGNTAIFDYQLGSNQWVGGRIPLTLGSEGIDLSNIERISLKMKTLNASGTVKTYIRIGRLGEDLDSDGILDKESADFQTGFIYNVKYGTDTYAMKVGSSPDGKSGNSQIDTEDLNGNELLDTESADTIVTFEGGTAYTEPSSSWKTISLSLTSDMRSQLHNSTGIEIFIVETAGSNASGKLLLGEIYLAGSSFVTAPGNGQNVSAQEINEIYIDQSGNALEEDFPEIHSIFSTSGTTQNIGILTWEAVDGTWDSENGSWTATTFTQPVKLSDYRKLTFYMKTPSPAPDQNLDSSSHSMAISFFNPNGRGLKFYFTPVESTSWQKYTLDYTTNTLTVNGVSRDLVISQHDLSAEDINKFIIAADCGSAGKLYLDEVHLEDPVFGVSGEITSQFTYAYPGVILTAWGVPLVSDLIFTNSSRAAGKDFATGFTTPDSSDLYTSSTLAFSLLSSRLSGNLDIKQEEQKVFFSPGYTVTIPLFNSAFTFNDSYNEYKGVDTHTVSKISRVDISSAGTFISVSSESQYSDTNLNQTWNADINTLVSIYTLNSALSLGMKTKKNPFEGKSGGETLLEAYKLIIPVSYPLPERSVDLKLNQTADIDNFQLTMDEIFTTDLTGTTERKLSSTQSLNLSIPIIFQKDTPSEWKLVPSYGRYLSLQKTSGIDRCFFTDFSSSVKNTVSQSYYFSSFPGYELFGNTVSYFSDISSGYDTVTYRPDMSLSLSRHSENKPSDILIPSSAHISFSRTMKREWDSVTDTQSLSFNTGSTVFNLFGKLGSHPVFDWYQTEEFSTKTGIEAVFIPRQDPDLTLTTSQYVNFTIKKEESLDFESNISFRWLPFSTEGTVITSYNWLIPIKGKHKIPVIDPEGTADSYFLHHEKFTAKYNYADEINELNMTFTLKHNTDLVIGEKGTLSASAGIGFSRSRISQDNSVYKYYRIGFEGGIYAQLNF